MANQIGTLAEKSLHAGLKAWLAQPGDQVEVPVDGFFIDIVREDLLIEIQTRHFGAMKRKLAQLLPNHRVLLVHPIAQEKWIVREKPALSKTEVTVFTPISRRKSPKRGRPIDIFRELVRIPHLLTHPNLTIAVLLTQQEEVLRDDGQGSWRRKKWSVADHRLLAVVAEHRLSQPADYLTLLPDSLPQPFTTQDLAETAVITRNLAQRTTYTLSRAGFIKEVGKQGNFKLYTF
ncbi:MAG: hypothetical protein KC419_07900 [Anaerolineales bacterium]|nr:hypothetical protein [Anaerolineales bacterium]MCA9928383.1 hypothetical protein [Anaerolineales bacterium]